MRELVDPLDDRRPDPQPALERRPAMRHAIPPTLRKETPHSTGSQAAMTHEEHKVVT